MAWDAVVKARPSPTGGEVQLQTWAEMLPWQVRQARGLALATPYPKEAKEALLEEALLQVLELRLQVLWPLKLALGAPVAEPTLVEFLLALGPLLRPLGQQLLQAQHAVSTRKPEHAVVALSSRTCSLGNCTARQGFQAHRCTLPKYPGASPPEPLLRLMTFANPDVPCTFVLDWNAEPSHLNS